MIQEIKKISNSAIISELKYFPNQAVLWAIVDRNKIGKIFELPGGVVMVLENCRDPFVFVVGNLTDQSVETCISLVNGREFPMIYCNPIYHYLFLEKGWDFNLRAELRLKSLIKIETADEAMTIKPIDTTELFKKCFWYKETSELYGSDKDFLKYGTGYALCQDDQVVSEAYAITGGCYAEIGVIAHPDYRGKQHAAQVVSHLIKKCEEAKIAPMWSCHMHNRSSLRLGLKLGFFISNYFVQMIPKIDNVLSPSLASPIG
ncbi:GNAT family N-acetyltransferase [Candidatus Tisiphia endosymbiont of Dioctria rufipes]|uniref:GNAT family N-acetyltransferase n=1 Tax=Candidatus Tisiphia endosymbiont of Dioctria rufipes TaxID=3066255 RepID=UPI00312CB8E9